MHTSGQDRPLRMLIMAYLAARLPWISFLFDLTALSVHILGKNNTSRKIYTGTGLYDANQLLPKTT